MVEKSINYAIFQKLEKFAPIKLAESWDNVGMLIEPIVDVKINKILLTNDLTMKVMKEAIIENVQMIISYHPPIFNSLKHIKQNLWKEVIVAKCIKKDIFLYSPHTALDSVQGGINDWILSYFDVKYKKPIENAKSDLNDSGDHSLKSQLIHGAGRYCELKSPISLSEAIELLKKCFKSKNLLLAKNHSNIGMNDLCIKTIAVCPGSGATLLKSCMSKPDLWITGEMSHHDILDATENIDHPVSIILTVGHSNSERAFLTEVYQPWIENELKSENVEVIVSKVDTDPLVVV